MSQAAENSGQRLSSRGTETRTYLMLVGIVHSARSSLR